MAADGSVLSETITSYLVENSESNWSAIADASEKYEKRVAELKL